MSEDKEISDRKSPGFWFYTADFERDMQILPLAAQGLWIRMMCWASDNEEHRGFLELPTGQPMNDLDIAHRAGKPIKEVRTSLAALKRMGTFSEDSRGCIFSRRMARDTHISEVRRQAASKRASVIERAKDGTFAGAKQPTKSEQKPTVPESVSVSVSVPVKSSSTFDDKNKNGNGKRLTTIDEKAYATPRDALIALMCQTIGRQPEVKLVRSISETLELRGGTVDEFVADIRPRIERLKNPPGEGFFFSEAKKWGSIETAAAPEPETLEEKAIRTGPCQKCRQVGMVNGAYCDCPMGIDLARADRSVAKAKEAATNGPESRTA